MQHPVFLPTTWLIPQWPHISGVHTVFSSRDGGHSQLPWNSLNLGSHVGDNCQDVTANRAVFAAYLRQLSDSNVLPVHPIFLDQVHGCDVVHLRTADDGHGQSFDACVTSARGLACTMMVADCLPVLWAHRKGWAVAAAHAGWRGLAGQHGRGILECVWDAYCAEVRQQAHNTWLSTEAIAAETQVWLGPCIGPRYFEVGSEVHAAFTVSDTQASVHFQPLAQHQGSTTEKWLANLSGLARQRLQALGLHAIYGNDGSVSWCTYDNPSVFFSHRRDATVLGSTGRMAAAIWLC